MKVKKIPSKYTLLAANLIHLYNGNMYRLWNGTPSLSYGLFVFMCFVIYGLKIIGLDLANEYRRSETCEYYHQPAVQTLPLVLLSSQMLCL